MMANDHIANDHKKVRLIDAHEFWNRLSHVVYDIFTVHEKDGQLTGTASVGYYTETIEEVLKQTKTVDAVEVVRCEDCKHCCLDLSGRENHLCMRKENGWPVRRQRNRDAFCSYGEKREVQNARSMETDKRF